MLMKNVEEEKREKDEEEKIEAACYLWDVLF